MTSEFSDIKMISFDDAASVPSGDGALMRLIVTLSHSAPAAWSEYFNSAWKRHIYMMKRKAVVSGNRLEIVCMPEELEKDHLPELKKVISETNEAYAKHVAEQGCVKKAEEAKAQQQKEQLATLKNRLKFD